IAGCFESLRAEVLATPPPDAGTINWFLWKPEAESGYNPNKLVILIGQSNLRVFANGVELRDYGPGSGRCTQVRSTGSSGCGFGRNARVEVYDSRTGAPYLFPDGNPYFIVPNGCERTEFRV